MVVAHHLRNPDGIKVTIYFSEWLVEMDWKNFEEYKKVAEKYLWKHFKKCYRLE